MIPSDDCTLARESISAQLDGELPELDFARLSAHLRDCPACAYYARELAAITAGLRAAALEQPECPVVLRRPRRLLPVWAASAAAVALVAASFLSVDAALHPRGAQDAAGPRVGSAFRQDATEQRFIARLAALDAAPMPPVGRSIPV